MKEYNVNIKIFGKEFKSKMMAPNEYEARIKARLWLTSQATIRITPEPTDNSFLDFFNSIISKK